MIRLIVGFITMFVIYLLGVWVSFNWQWAIQDQEGRVLFLVLSIAFVPFAVTCPLIDWEDL